MPDWTLVLPNNTTLGLTESNDLAVVGITGAGMPPIKNVYTPYGLSDGALWQRASVQPRLVTVLIDAVGTSWVGLHNLRAKLVEAVNPHGATPITIQYSAGGSKPDLYLDCYYDSGLEGGITEGFAEKGLALRFLATDPYWQQGTSTTANLAHIQTVTDVSGVVWRKTNGTINNMDTGVYFLGELLPVVYSLVQTTEGIEVYGGFVSAGSLSILSLGVARWDGANWESLSPPWDTLEGYASGGIITAGIADGPSLTYASGYYTGAGGRTKFGVWKYDRTTWTWISRNEASNISAIAVSPSGVLWAAMLEIEEGTGYPHYYIRHYTDATWISITTGPLSKEVTALTFAPNGVLYVGGAFTSIDGIPAEHVAQYNPMTGIWTAMGKGLNSNVFALIVGPDNKVYAGGEFTASDTKPMARVAVWNGVTWEKMGDGLDGMVRHMAINNGGLVAAGDFYASGSRALPSRVAWWRDNLWVDSGFGYASVSPNIYVTSFGNDAYVGGTFSGTWVGAGATAVTNAGTTRAYPVITIKGPGPLYYVVNWTTGQWLYFDITLLEGETVTLDLRQGIKTATSDFRGNILPYLISGSLIDWHLDPGVNNIGVWINHASATASISFTARYWSADGAAST